MSVILLCELLQAKSTACFTRFKVLVLLSSISLILIDSSTALSMLQLSCNSLYTITDNIQLAHIHLYYHE